uniref:50S ribosomal protein L13 n=1 Tax=Campylaephora sungminbooi TaxID=1896769 RepID=A0A1B0RRK6_9FLOR|nr:50S ribosomal protein L13 [Campylaephora sungminbooi]AKU47402.1 50S ribosomal protein L13 [Campylaephora sungminbooi]ALN11849.1 50S ribosomal protein L13 [Campylaephora sungminbooi]
MNTNQTYIQSKKIAPSWYLIDAKEQTLGRVSTNIANLLRGKNESNYSSNINHHNYIIIINSKQIKVTGKKNSQKLYKRHSGKPGSMKIETFTELQKRIPNRILEKAIKGMLPKGRLGRELFTQIKIYEEEKHPHTAQNPKLINL